MKLYTESDILNYLVSNVRLSLGSGSVIYFVSVDDDGELVTDGMCNDHNHDVDYVISDPASYLGVSQEEYDSMEDMDAFYAKENADDEDFMGIVKELTEEVNALVSSLA
ncbi:MAG: hypothetical protein ACI4QB_08760 [Eubacteriales bacterium]